MSTVSLRRAANVALWTAAPFILAIIGKVMS